MRYRIQIIENERDISDGVSTFLSAYDYVVCQSLSGKEGIHDFESFKPHIVLLDTTLSDMRGTALCQILKKNKAEVGIIILTALSLKKNVVEGFKSGADDFILKPFDLDILLVRIEALLKRLNLSKSEYDKKAFLQFDLYKNDVYYSGKFVGLTQTEFRILHYLHGHEGFLSSEAILEHLYGTAYSATPSRTISVHIANIRKKIAVKGVDDIEIISKYKIGYRLDSGARCRSY